MVDEKERCRESDCIVYLVDDDIDDRDFFREALKDVSTELRLLLFSGGDEDSKSLSLESRCPTLYF